MNHLKAKKILVGITGSIAAYKAAELIRLLRALEADVKVVMTKEASQFVHELTFQALSGQPVYRELLDPDGEASMSHITLAKWADVLLIAPATANIIAMMVSGVASDLLTTLYLATPAPVVIVPAMNQQMWQHAATQRNKAEMLARGHFIWGPKLGQQACGDVGPGRMMEPTDIVNQLDYFFAPKWLKNISIVITAGPTREPIDPVRYLSNYSSGKMGYALAKAAAVLGANVILISGPTALSSPSGIKTIKVETAADMQEAVLTNMPNCDIFISCAAVCDYKLARVQQQKIKKPALPSLDLIENNDILMAVKASANPPFLVGFSAESENLLTNAKEKLARKQIDMIVANDISAADRGFDSDYNEVFVLTDKAQHHLTLATKQQIADDLMPLILHHYQAKKAFSN